MRCLFREASILSQKGLEYLEDRLQAFNEGYLLEKAEHGGCPGSLAGGGRVSSHSRRAPAVSLTTLIPLILILMTIREPSTPPST